MPPLLYARSLQHSLFPRLQFRELIDIDTGPSCSRNPAPVRDIRDGAFVAY